MSQGEGGCPIGNEAQAHAVRIIEDFAIHRRWVLTRNSFRPAAPAGLSLLPAGTTCGFIGVENQSDLKQKKFQRRRNPIIRAGDKLILLEQNPILDARFEAVALDSADADEMLMVRLKIGGGTVRALATAPGEASLLSGGWGMHP